MSTEPNEFSFLPDDYCDRSVRRRLTAAAIAILAIFAIAHDRHPLAVSRAIVETRHAAHTEVTRIFDRAIQSGEQAYLHC